MRFIVFDCDGTLVNSQQELMQGIRMAWNAEGLSAPLLSSVLSIVGLPLDEAILSLNPKGGEEQNTRLKLAYLNAFSENIFDTETDEVLYDGVIETLQTINTDNTLMAIVTGRGRQGLQKVLDRHDLGKFFAITKTADCGAGKSNPQVLLEAMAEVGADKKNTIIIGDTIHDIEMGNNAKIKSIGVSFGYHSVDDLKNAGASIIVDDFSYLPQAINTILEE